MRWWPMKSTLPQRGFALVSNPPTDVASACVSGFAGLQCTDRAVREEIQHRAYSIWVSEGRPPHREMEHWLAAETEVLGENLKT